MARKAFLKSFWKSRNLFIKRLLAAGGQGIGRMGLNVCSFFCSLAHPAGDRLGIDRTKRLYARPVWDSLF